MTGEKDSVDIGLAQEGYRRAAWRLIPFLVLLFVLAWIDGVNVGFATLFSVGKIAAPAAAAPQATR